jgi:hypothetical protein
LNLIRKRRRGGKSENEVYLAADEELRRRFPVVELSATRIKAVVSETAREKRRLMMVLFVGWAFDYNQFREESFVLKPQFNRIITT